MLKFIESYPSLMDKYDIHDQYELHNLLKKVIDPSLCHDIDFNRQPIMRFGSFNREEAIFNAISLLSPVTTTDLVDYLHDEYGYDRLFIQMSILPPFSRYYHDGVYTVNFKQMPPERQQRFLESLDEDFYYQEEIERKYFSMFPDAEKEEINPRSIKALGFSVFSKYLLRNYPSVNAYFLELLTKDDIVDLKPIRKRYGSIVMMSNTLYELFDNYDLIEFEPGKCINIRRLEDQGITKNDLRKYCQEVNDYLEDGYFTIYSLRNSGFVSYLDELGFDDTFYSSILARNESFIWERIFTNTVLYKGNEETQITVKSFILSVAKDYDSISVDDLVELIKFEYGINADR
jgi:hypothetical protein